MLPDILSDAPHPLNTRKDGEPFDWNAATREERRRHRHRRHRLYGAQQDIDPAKLKAEMDMEKMNKR